MPRRTSSFPKDLCRPAISRAAGALTRASRLLAALVARDEPVREPGHRDRERDEDDRRRDVRRVVEAPGDVDLRLAERLDDAEQRDERRVLLEPDEVVQERRDDAAHGLRDDDEAERLRRA